MPLRVGLTLMLTCCGCGILLALGAAHGLAAPTAAPPGAWPGAPRDTATPLPCGVGTWSQQALYPILVRAAAAAAQDGLLYSFGGGSGGTATAAAYKYDPGTNTWTPLAPLPQALGAAGVVSDGRYLYILNGVDANVSPLNSLYRYDPLTDSYTTLAPSPQATGYQGAVYLGGQIFRIGGYVGGSSATATVDVYTVATDSWAPAGTVAPYPFAASGLTAVAAGGYIYSAGGGGAAGYSTKTYRYDSASNSWADAPIADLPDARADAAGAMLNGRWILTGGETGGSFALSSVVGLDLSQPMGAWVRLPDLLQPRAAAASASLAGALYIVGGQDPGLAITRDTQRYTEVPCTPTPTVTGTPPTATPSPTSSATPSPTVPTSTPTATATPATCGPGSNYRVSESMGAPFVPGTSLIAGTQCHYCPPLGIGLPFPYTLYDQTFSTVVINSGGVLSFAAQQQVADNSCLPTDLYSYAIMPYWDDLDMSATLNPNLGVYSSTSGEAPHRIFNIEYRACHWSAGSCGGYVNFEVRLYEGQARFDVVYGSLSGNGNNATVGVQRDTGSLLTQYECMTGGLASGLSLTFSQACVTPTPIATNTPGQTPTATRTPVGGPATVTATACPARFSDVQPPDYFYTPVTYLACHGVIAGYADGTFRPYANTTRAQMVKLVVLGFGRPAPSATPPGGYTFADVPPAFPFYAVIETAAADGIVAGYGCGGPGEPCDAQHRPYFRPYANVTRGQLAKIDVGAAGWPLQNPATPSFSDVAPGSAFYAVVETAVCRGVLSGYADGTFRPGAAATRGQISKIVYLSITGSAICGPGGLAR